ncbi:hypothetical protein [Nocardia sp. NPDC049707]
MNLGRDVDFGSSLDLHNAGTGDTPDIDAAVNGGIWSRGGRSRDF